MENNQKNLSECKEFLKSDKKSFALSMSGSIEIKPDISNKKENIHGWKEIFFRLYGNMQRRHYSPRDRKFLQDMDQQIPQAFE